MADDTFPGWHGTTIIGVRKNGEVVIAGDGQVSVGQTVMKGRPKKCVVYRRVATMLLLVLQDQPLTPLPSLNGLKKSLRQRPASSRARLLNWRKTGARINISRNWKPC